MKKCNLILLVALLLGACKATKTTDSNVSGIKKTGIISPCYEETKNKTNYILAEQVASSEDESNAIRKAEIEVDGLLATRIQREIVTATENFLKSTKTQLSEQEGKDIESFIGSYTKLNLSGDKVLCEKIFLVEEANKPIRYERRIVKGINKDNLYNII